MPEPPLPHTDRAPGEKPPFSATRLRVVVISDAEAARNGVGTYYQDLATHLRGQVGSFTVVAPQRDPPAGHQRLSLPLPGDATQRLFVPRVRALARLLQEQRPHVIVIPSLGPYAAAGLWLAKRRSIPVAVAHHTNFDRLVDLYWNPLWAAPSRWALSGAVGWLLRRADTVVAMNVESLEDAKRRGAKQARIAGTPLAAPFLHVPCRPLRTPLSRVIFLGRLAAEKGVHHILEAAQRLPHFRFSIGGDGPLRGRVKQAAARLANLDYLGWLNRGQVLEAIDDADVLVLPSAIETFGTVALEAQARRRAVLVSEDCGITLWPALAEFLFTIRRDEHVAEALTRLARLPLACRQSAAEEGWKAASQFNEETIRRWIDILLDVADRGSRQKAREDTLATGASEPDPLLQENDFEPHGSDLRQHHLHP